MRNFFKSLPLLSGAVDKFRNLALFLVPTYLRNLLWLIETKFFTLAKEGYAQNAAVYGCLRLLSNSIPEPPLVVYLQDSQGEKTQVPYQDPVNQLLLRPNELMTQYEMVELTAIHLGIVGRSHWWKERAIDGTIISLWPLRPDRVGPIYSTSEAEGEKVLWGWSYLVPGEAHYVPIARSEVLTYNLPDPAGETGGIIEGLGPLQAVANEVAADNEATKFVGSVLANYGQPGWAIRLKRQIRDENEAKIVKDGFMDEFGGTNRGRPMLLDADAELEKLSFTLTELEFPNLRMIAESRIAAAFGVPPILIGLFVGLKHAASRANIEQSREIFTETTCTAWWRRIQSWITLDVAREFDPAYVVEFDMDQVAALAAQRVRRIQPIRQAWLDGAATLNDYRAVMKLAPLDPARGDVVLRQNNTTVVGVSDEAEQALDQRQDELAARQITQQQQLTAGNSTPGDNGPDDSGDADAMTKILGPHVRIGRKATTLDALVQNTETAERLYQARLEKLTPNGKSNGNGKNHH